VGKVLLTADVSQVTEGGRLSLPEGTLTAHLFAEIDLRRTTALFALQKLGIELAPTPSETSLTGRSSRSSYLLELWGAADTAVAAKWASLKRTEQKAAELAVQHLLGAGLVVEAWEVASARSTPETLAAMALAATRLGEIGLPRVRILRLPRPPAQEKRGRGRPPGSRLRKQDAAALRQFLRGVFAGKSESEVWNEVCPLSEGLTRRKRLQERLATYVPTQAARSKGPDPLSAARLSALREARLALAEEASQS
jgi:hypothetical protein